MSSEVEEQKTESEAKLSESTEAMNFSKQTFKNPNKLNLTKRRKLKLKRHLTRQNIRLRLDSCFKKNGNFKSSRKRIHHGKFFTCSYKRRKKEHGVIIPPTKFLLGGNICDPLNLNSLQDEETNRAMNAATPKSSPMPTPKHRRGEIEVILPRNMNDPLNLASCTDENEYEMDLKLTVKRRKHRNRKRKRGSSGSGSGKDDNNEPVLNNVQDESTSANAEVVEPVVKIAKVDESEDTPAYSGGFSIRNPPPFESPMYYDGKKNHYVFQDSPGMNSRGTPLYSYPESPVNRNTHQYCMESPSYTPSGRNTPYYSMESPSYHPSISESPNYRRPYALDSPNYVQQSPNYHSGMNTPFHSMESPSYQSLCSVEQKRSPQDHKSADENDKKNCDKFFPISMPILYGPVDPPGISTQEDSNCPKKFPHNVTFVQGNYVLESDVLLQAETPQFHVILALSITKWIHLNWGDAGLKQAFRRMYSQLKPGGVLILESQSWSSYMRKKNLTENIYNNFHSIEFMPHQFTDYLLSPEVGFSKVEVIGAPVHMPKGFQRVIQVFTKSDGETPSSSNTPASLSTPSNVRYTPYFNRQNDRQPVYSALTVSASEMDDDASQSPKPNFSNNLVADTGQSVRLKFSPSDAEPRGAKLDISDDILKGSEISLSITKDVDQGSNTVEVLKREPKEDDQAEEAPNLDAEDGSNPDENLPEINIRNSNDVINRKSSKVKALVSPV
ncbi:UNVERIFIED_CONTAM: hypothetical protein PYX00_010347 [Menopon gallinae]|uniref:RNA methyltransferase n=1 Tax=Menopon gallinae TaxID=328185 RepID=A0AAW2HF32_9NEOP